jgi:ribosomal protein S18 acetylase RimI-like enzyme
VTRATVEVRVARLEEWRAVRDLRLRALADAPDAFGSTLEQERRYGEREWVEWISGWEDTTNRLFVAVDGDEWLGIAIGSRTSDEATAHVYSMWVDPTARRAGIGRRLVQEVVEWSRSTGARELELNVTATNPGAIAFYERMGFADAMQRRPLREGSTAEVILMRRALA